MQLVRAIILVAAALAPFASTHALTVGTPAPALTAHTLDGESFDLAKARGDVVIVNFWASWCSPCRHEMPALDAYFRQHRTQHLRVITINIDDAKNAQQVRDILQPFSFSAAFSGEADYRGFGRIWRLPMTFVIDAQGLLRRDGSVGSPLIDADILEATVTPLLPK